MCSNSGTSEQVGEQQVALVADGPVVDLDEPGPAAWTTNSVWQAPNPTPSASAGPAPGRRPARGWSGTNVSRSSTKCGGGDSRVRKPPRTWRPRRRQRLQRVQLARQELLDDQRRPRGGGPGSPRSGRGQLGRVADQDDVLAGHALARLHHARVRHVRPARTVAGSCARGQLRARTTGRRQAAASRRRISPCSWSAARPASPWPAGRSSSAASAAGPAGGRCW